MICLDCALWATRYHELAKELLAMKREGFASPSPQPSLPVEPPELPTNVLEAIQSVSVPGDATYRHLTQWAWSMKRLNKPDEQITADILAGEQVEL